MEFDLQALVFIQSLLAKPYEVGLYYLTVYYYSLNLYNTFTRGYVFIEAACSHVVIYVSTEGLKASYSHFLGLLIFF